MEVVGQTYFTYLASSWCNVCILSTSLLRRCGSLLYYIIGSIGMMWFGTWLFVTFDSPDKHPRISTKEKNYIESSIGDPKTTSIVSSSPIIPEMIKHMQNPVYWLVQL